MPLRVPQHQIKPNKQKMGEGGTQVSVAKHHEHRCPNELKQTGTTRYSTLAKR